jgi:hypothetical protein
VGERRERERGGEARVHRNFYYLLDCYPQAEEDGGLGQEASSFSISNS